MSDIIRDRVVAALGDMYEVESELGRGGMAIVYKARDVRLRRRVAIKVLPPDLAFRDDVRTRFLREAETSAQLSHQHIVPIYSVDERDGVVYFVMGLVEGETLGELLARAPRPPIDVVTRILSEVADALHYAHARGVVHRDIKPDNILIERDGGRALVTDFGIARAAEAESRLTVTGVAVGTPAYMSPEQALGEHELDGRSDLYSLGIVGYEMLAGELPFRAANTPAMMMKHVGETPRPMRERRLDCPPALARAIDVALAKKPEDRWPDGAAFKRAILDAQAAAPAPAIPVKPARVASADEGARPLDEYPPYPQAPAYPRHPGAGPSARQQWHDAQREWRDQVRSQQDSWRERERDWRERQREWRRTQRERERSEFSGMPLEDQVRAFRRQAVGSAGTLTFLAFINVVFTPFFPWVVFPAAGFLSRSWRKFEHINAQGVSLRDALSSTWRERLEAKGKVNPPLRRPEEPGRALAATASADATHAVSPDVLHGPFGDFVRRAADDRAVILDSLRKLSDADRSALPDIAPTASSLFERVAELSTSLHRMAGDVAPDALARVDARIAAAQAEPADARERERKLTLLQRQRETLNDLRERRELLVTQLESASLVLQNLRLDLIKLRAVGIDAASTDLNSATQEARALSRDIGHVIDAAAEVRRIQG